MPKSSGEFATELFTTAVVESFKFLEEDYGFSRPLIKSNNISCAVIYKNSNVYVILKYGSPDFEPNLSFGRIGIDDAEGAFSFYPGDLIKLEVCIDWLWNSAAGKDARAWVVELARLLATCGSECLYGKGEIYAKMKERRISSADSWKEEEKCRAVRSKIEDAWIKKDYQLIVNLYSEISNLTDIDSKRLSIAKSRTL